MIHWWKSAAAIVTIIILLIVPIFAGIPVSSSPDLKLGYRKFVVYYGSYLSSEGKITPDLDRIINSKPELVISPYYTWFGKVNLVPDVVKRLHYNGIKVIAYVATHGSNRN